MGKAAHLARRFFTSLWPGGPGREGDAWAVSFLSDAEAELWRRMSGPDRRHALRGARRVVEALEARSPDDVHQEEIPGEAERRAVVAAALLHDVGKVDAGLGTYGRVVATLSAAVAGRQAAEDWVRTQGFTRKVGLYLVHPRLGGDLLDLAGSHPLTVAWAREHHLPPAQWSVPAGLAEILQDADDD